MGQHSKPSCMGQGGSFKKKGGVINNGSVIGPNSVKSTSNIEKKVVKLVADRKGVHREPSLHKIPSKVTQNKHVGVRNSIPLSSKLVNRSIGVKEDNTCTRNPPGRFKASNGKENSVSSAGSILCCSSLNSSDIRNCNKQFWNRNDMAMADKVWKGVVELGVEGEEVEEVYRGRISNNEKRDTETKKSREHNKQVKP
ncbi:hypothetical protein A2U01_0014103 [Trifolium medium]|uniref:Uncharacterized protein n=1 Tax=Trifolium medium TaxID=97028 RepID=A0A392N1X2_9FABA|nr:hypothetical protein [Trifolium medium]